MTDRAVAASLRRRRSLAITVQYVQRCQNRCFCRPRDVAGAARRSTILHSSACERPLRRLKIRLSLSDQSPPLNRGGPKVGGGHRTNKANRNDRTTRSIACSGPNGALASQVRENGAPLER